MQTRFRSLTTAAVVLFVFGAVSGCLQRDLKELNPCLVSGVTAEISVTNVDKVDLLFVVDDSQSMLQEQASLRDQFPKLVTTLTSGQQLNPDGSIRGTFPAVTDLHLGVVSTDMGLVGVEGVPSCVNGLGGDGRLKTAGSPDVGGCNAMYPNYLSFVENGNPMQIASDFQCVASVGTGGCGFEQQLESGLKALWPAMDIDPSTGMQWVDPSTGAPGNRVTFLPDASGAGRFGHGDGANMGFLRNDIRGGVSLIGIIMVTDEEDCSSSNTVHFTPAQYLPDGNMLKDQPINLRCFYNKNNLYGVERYINGLRALRQGQENLVVFAAIAGIPTDLVELRDADGNPTVDLDDDDSRNQWYSRILGDQRMIERVDETQPEVAKRNLVPSCNSDTGRAFPPRRIVEVAQGFGPNGVVQSICQNDFSGAMDAIIEIIAKQLGTVCLPRQLVPDSEGAVGCEVLWELPTPQFAGMGVPVSCQERDYLDTPGEGKDLIGDKGGNLCVVNQLKVLPADRANAKREGIGDAEKMTIVAQVKSGGDGWFYDDFSVEVVSECPASEPQRITFTDAAKPPTGVTVLLECLSESQSLALDYDDLNPLFYSSRGVSVVAIGDPCANVPDGVTGGKGAYYDGLKPEGPTYAMATDPMSGTGLDKDALCRVKLNDGFDERMFCDPQSQLCVRECNGDDACPPAWVCDQTANVMRGGNSVAICVNPTCGE